VLNDKKYIGMDVHKESISIAVRDEAGKIVMECVIETKAGVILQSIDGLRGELQVTSQEVETSGPPRMFVVRSRDSHFRAQFRSSRRS
jgi:hypothetical protein